MGVGGGDVIKGQMPSLLSCIQQEKHRSVLLLRYHVRYIRVLAGREVSHITSRGGCICACSMLLLTICQTAMVLYLRVSTQPHEIVYGRECLCTYFFIRYTYIWVVNKVLVIQRRQRLEQDQPSSSIFRVWCGRTAFCKM